MPYSSTFGLHIRPVKHSAPHSAPHSVPHSMFHFVTGLLITFGKFQCYSTNLHTRDYHSGQKQFLSILPDFQENLHCVQNRSQKWVWWDFDVSPPGYVAINRKISPIPQIYTLETTILAKNNSCQFSQISRKIYIVCKIGPKIELGGTLMSHPLAMWQSIES